MVGAYTVYLFSFGKGSPKPETRRAYKARSHHVGGSLVAGHLGFSLLCDCCCLAALVTLWLLFEVLLFLAASNFRSEHSYGLNRVDVPLPAFSALLKEHLVAPFFVFQV